MRKYRVLVDADILLELLYNRSPFVEEAEYLFERLQKLERDGELDFYMTDITLERIVGSHKHSKQALKMASYFRSCFVRNFIQVTSADIERARNLNFPDFESAVEYVSAASLELDAIITQNRSNYPNSPIQIWNISSFLARFNLERGLEKERDKIAISDLLRYSGDVDMVKMVLKHEFKGLSDRDIDWLFNNGNRQTILPGQAIVHEGQALDSIYLILEGEFEITTKNKKNLPEEIPTLTVEGGIIGEMTFLRTRKKIYRPSATVKAHKESYIWSIPSSSLEKKINSDAGFGVSFYELLGKIISDRLEALNKFRTLKKKKGIDFFRRRKLPESSSYAPLRTLGGLLYAIDGAPSR